MFTWLSGSDNKPPIFLEIRSSKTFIILTVATGIFTDIFLYAVVVPVLPFALTARVRVEPSSIQKWISIFLALYGAALLVASPICGWISDRIESRRSPMLLGLIALLGSTAMLCFGRSISVLAAGRLLQGLSAAVVWIVGLALLVDTVGPEGIGEAMGYVGLGLSLATLLAPLLGGLVFGRGGYYAVFAMTFGLLAFDIFLRIMMVEKKFAVKWLKPTQQKQTPKDDNTPDEEQSVAKSGSKSADDNEKGCLQITAREGLDGKIVSSAPGQITHESTSATTRSISSRLPPVITLLASRRLLSALWCCVAGAILYSAIDAVLPLFVRNTFHWTSTGAGLIFLTIFVPCFLSPVVGKLSDKYGPRWFTAVGSVVACPCLILLRLVHEDNMKQKVLLCGLLTLIGTCLVLIMTPIMAEITYAVEAKTRRRPVGFYGKNGAYAQAYGLFNVAWAAGSMIGPLLGGLTNGSGGWGTSTLILGCISIFTAVPAAFWTGGSIFKKMAGEKHGNMPR